MLSEALQIKSGVLTCAGCFQLITSYSESASSLRTASGIASTRTLSTLEPKVTWISSPILSSSPGFATLPFTSTLPCSHASLATVRRFIILEFFKNLSNLICLSVSFLRVCLRSKRFASDPEELPLFRTWSPYIKTSKRADSLSYPRLLDFNYLFTASLRDLPALNTGALEAGIEITLSGF